MISGKTTLIAHLGYPTESFKAPLIYNPWFDSKGIDAVVVPMGVKAEDYAAFFGKLMRLSNIRGALVTMPHKVTTVDLLDEASTAVKVAGSCNAVLLRDDGKIVGDMFDGAGFARGLKRKGFDVRGESCLIVGTGGVGSAIAASLAADGVGAHGAVRYQRGVGGRPCAAAAPVPSRDGGSDRLQRPRGLRPRRQCHAARHEAPAIRLPFDVSRISKDTFVGEVVMKQEITPLLEAAREDGCRPRSAPTCCSSRFPRTSSSSGSARRPPTSCAPWRR